MKQLELLPLVASLEAVLAHGGFRRASRARSISKATLSRHVAALEEALGVKLLERNTRLLSPTREGQLLVEHFRRVRSEWTEGIEEVVSGRDALRGSVRLTAPHVVAMGLLPPMLSELSKVHPDIVVELNATDELLRVGEDIDIALRTGPLPSSELRAVKLMDTMEVVVGRRELLADVEDFRRVLFELPWVVHAIKPLGPGRTLTGPDGETLTVNARKSVVARSSDGMVALLREGLGLGLLPDAFIRAELDRGELVKTGWRGRPTPLYAVFAKRELAPRRLQAVIEHLRGQFRRHR